MANRSAVAIECIKRSSNHEYEPGQPLLIEVPFRLPPPPPLLLTLPHSFRLAPPTCMRVLACLLA